MASAREFTVETWREEDQTIASSLIGSGRRKIVEE